MAAELLAQRQWVTQQTDFMQESLQQHLHTRAGLENAKPGTFHVIWHVTIIMSLS